MKKYITTYAIWLTMVVIWNFGYPQATPLQDVVAAIILAIFSSAVIYKALRQVWDTGRRMGNKNPHIARQQKEKEERKLKILELFGNNTEIGNDDVEKLLGVSDATATNYLQELEDERKIEQIGERGRYVVYRIK